MPVSVSDRQHRFMMAIAHSPKFSAQAGVPVSVGQKFLAKDRAACYPMKDKSKCTGGGEPKPDTYNHPKSRQRRKARKFGGMLELTQKRFFSSQSRRELAKGGAALPDGSFPILNEEDLQNAVSLVGMGKDPAKARAHIISRARELGLTGKLPKSWGVQKSFLDILKIS